MNKESMLCAVPVIFALASAATLYFKAEVPGGGGWYTGRVAIGILATLLSLLIAVCNLP